MATLERPRPEASSSSALHHQAGNLPPPLAISNKASLQSLLHNLAAPTHAPVPERETAGIQDTGLRQYKLAAEQEEGLGEAEEEEEVLETLRDDDEVGEESLNARPEEVVDVQTNVALQISQLTHALFDAIDALLTSLYDADTNAAVSDARRSMSACRLQEGEERGASIRTLNTALHQLVAAHDAVLASPSSEEDYDLLSSLNELLETLEAESTEETPSRAEGSPDPSRVASPRLQRRTSGATVVSTSSDELRDPFQDSNETEVLARLLRCMSSLERQSVSPSAVSPANSLWPAIGPQPASRTEPQDFHPAPEEPSSPLSHPGLAAASKKFPHLRSLIAARRARLRSPDASILSPRVLSRRGSFSSSIVSSSANHRDREASSEGVDLQSGRLSRASLLSGSMTVGGSNAEGKMKGSTSVLSFGTAGAGSVQPPRYSDEVHGFSADAAMAEQPREGHLSWSDRMRMRSHPHSPARSRPLENVQDLSSSAYGARTEQDLQIVEASIDRIYHAIPQLQDQRSVLQPEQRRERAIAELVERIVNTPRMEDQRAPPPSSRRSSVIVSSPTSPLNPGTAYREPQSTNGSWSPARLLSAASIRRRFSVSSFVGKPRSQAKEEELNGKVKEMDDSVSSAPRSLRSRSVSASVATPEDELLRLLSMASHRSRMADQDARMRPRSKTLARDPSISSARPQPRAINEAAPVTGSGAAAGGLGAGNVDDAMQETTRVNVAEQDALAQEGGIARVYSEWHDNLGLAVIMIWSDHSEMKVPVIESITSERVTVCLSEPLRRVDVLSAGHCSFANSDGQFTGQGTSTQPYKINVKCQATAASVQTQHTLVRIKHLHAMYCHACKHQLVQLSSPVRLAPMPADGWEEMLDAWMCHDDQAMNQHILRGKAVMAGQESTASSMIFVSDLWLHITKACFMSAQRPGVICQDESISCRECGAYLGQTRPQPSSDETLLFARHQFELQGKADSTEREQPPSLAAAVRAYLSSIVARSGARHLILSSSDNDEQACTLWIFKEHIVLASGLVGGDHTEAHMKPAMKILTRQLSSGSGSEASSTLEPLTLAAPLEASFRALLAKNTTTLPACLQHLADWQVSRL